MNKAAVRCNLYVAGELNSYYINSMTYVSSYAV